MDDKTQKFLHSCEEVARIGAGVLQSWVGRFTAREKAPADLVSEADYSSQQAIFSRLREQYPNHAFLGEENTPVNNPAEYEYRWIVDPLDGTVNYVHQMPNWSVSVALERKGEVILGVVYDPSLDEMYSACVGEGAYLNGKQIQVSDVTSPAHAMVAASFPTNVNPEHPSVREFLNVLPATQAIRRMGSAALNLSYIAAGRFDGYWACSTKIWDIAAGKIILEEAGGTFTGKNGQPFDLENPHFLAAGSKELHQELLALLIA